MKSPSKESIAIVCDVDKTLTEETQLMPILQERFEEIKTKYDGRKFYGKEIRIEKPKDWFSVADALGDSRNGITYLDLFKQDFPDIIKEPGKLESYGAKVKLSPGIPQFFKELKKEWDTICNIDFFAISLGIKQIIEGMAFAQYMKEIYAGEFSVFYEEPSLERIVIKEAVSPFSKSAGIISIAKGSRSQLNKLLARQKYMFDYRNIICIGDGIPEIPLFAYARKRGASIICVYKEGSETDFQAAFNNKDLLARVDYLLPRNYIKGEWIWKIVNLLIKRILERKCNFDPVLLATYREQKLINKELKDIVERHINVCPECSSTFTLHWVPP